MQMDLLKNMNKALAYIEENLEHEIDYKKIASIAHCSEYHFRKMFSFLAGITLAEYIRRRRLTNAGFELSSQNVKVIDIALKYGYQSPDSFTKAFYKLHGLTPSEVRQRGHSLKAFPRMTFQLTIQGGVEMNYRIEDKEAFTLVGIKKRVPIVFKGENTAITAMWAELDSEKIKQLNQLSNTEPKGLISASFNFSEERMEEKGELDHLIGVATTSKEMHHFETQEVKAATWAIFKIEGKFPEDTQNVWGRIYSEWFPSSSYEAVDGPELLWTEGKATSAPNFKSEIWIPVKKRKA